MPVCPQYCPKLDVFHAQRQNSMCRGVSYLMARPDRARRSGAWAAKPFLFLFLFIYLFIAFRSMGCSSSMLGVAIKWNAKVQKHRAPKRAAKRARCPQAFVASIFFCVLAPLVLPTDCSMETLTSQCTGRSDKPLLHDKIHQSKEAGNLLRTKLCAKKKKGKKTQTLLTSTQRGHSLDV